MHLEIELALLVEVGELSVLDTVVLPESPVPAYELAEPDRKEAAWWE